MKRWLVPALAAAAFLAVALTAENQKLFLALNALGPLTSDWLWANVTVLGDTLVAFALLLPLWRRRPDLVWAFVFLALLGTAWAQGLKQPFDVPRPPAVFGDAIHVIGPAYKTHSFPSGHATTAFAVAGLLALGLRKRSITAVAVGLASIVALSRAVVGVHWPLDILAGAFGGWLSAIAAIFLATKTAAFGSKPWVQWAVGIFLALCAAWLVVGHERSGYPQADLLQRAIGICCLLSAAATLNDMQVSVVIPIYNEEASLPRLVERVGGALHNAGRSFELICVDDGSRDGSATVLEKLAAERSWLKPLYLIRNYGQSAALQAGFDAAQGEIIVTLDGDLQNDPDDVPGLLKILDERPEVDVISGWRKDRQDRTLSRKVPSMAANRIISRVTGVQLHDYGCALKVYRAEVIRGLRLYGELHRFIPALAAEVGARIIEVPVRHHAREHGVSKYGLDRTFRVLLDLLWIKFLLRFLHRPIQAFGGFGLAFGAAGFLILAWLAAEKILLEQDIGGRPLLLLGVLLAVIGVQLVATGLIGELTRIYHEPQGRPQYLLRRQPRKGS